MSVRWHDADGAHAPALMPPRHDEESEEEGHHDGAFSPRHYHEESTTTHTVNVGSADGDDDNYSEDKHIVLTAVCTPVKRVTQNETASAIEEMGATEQEEMPHSKVEPLQGEVGFFQAILIHLRRVIQWRLALIAPMPKEAKALDKSEVTNDTLRAYLVWRRSMLLVSLPAVFVSAILAWINLASHYGDSKEVFNGFGDFLAFIPSAASTLLLISMVVVLFRWSHWRQSALIFRIGWSLSFIIPFLPAVFPISFLLISCEENYGVSDCNLSQGLVDEYNAIVDTWEFSYAITYAFELFPILITFPGGLSRAALKIRGLLPESTLSSWILVITSPFQSVIFIMALVVLIQLSGNIWLFIGTSLLFCGPWIYVIRRKVYVGVPTAEREKQLDRTQFIVGTCIRLGLIFFLIWAFTGDLGGVPLLGSGDQTTEYSDGTYITHYVVSYSDLLRVIFESIGRILVTTVLFADVLFRMTITNWRQDTGRREADTSGSLDRAFRSIEFSISSKKSKEKRNESDEEPASDTFSEDDE